MDNFWFYLLLVLNIVMLVWAIVDPNPMGILSAFAICYMVNHIRKTGF